MQSAQTECMNRSQNTQSTAVSASFEIVSLGVSIIISLLFLYLSATGYNLYFDRFISYQSVNQMKVMGTFENLEMRYERAVNKKIERLV